MLLASSYFVFLIFISAALPGLSHGSPYYAQVQPSSVYYIPGGISAIEFESPGQETLITEHDFLLLLGTEVDQYAAWKNRLHCTNGEATIETDGLFFGVTLTSGQGPGLGNVSLTIHNDHWYNNVDIEFAVSCMSIHNISMPGIYSLEIDYGIQNSTDWCPLIKESCLSGYQLFDTEYKNASTPMFSYADKTLEVRPDYEVISCGGMESYNWRMFLINNGTSQPVLVNDPNNNVLEIPAQTLSPGLYVVVLEVYVDVFSGNETHDEDYLYVQVILPELVASLKGATTRESNGSEVIVFDASRSYDAVIGFPVTSDILTTRWLVLSVLNMSHVALINCVASFPHCAVLESGLVSWHNISDVHQSHYLSLDTSTFPDDSSVFVIFSISRGSRVSSAIQAVYISSTVWPLSLSCLFNCQSSAKGKMAYQKLELDLTGQQGTAKYTWSAWKMVNYTFVVDTALTSQLAIYNRTMLASKNGIEEGMTYLFSVLALLSVDGNNYQTRVGYVRIVNYLPYGGSCNINKYSGDATTERFRVICKDWMDEGERTSRDPAVDSIAYLSYAVVQTSKGAYIEEETIAVSKSKKIFLYLKPGDSADDDMTNVTVQIIDMFGDAATVNFTVQSVPTFNVKDITADEAGATKVLDYMDVIKRRIQSERQRGSAADIILSIVTSSADQLIRIPLPRKPSEVAKTVDGEEGVLLDIDLADTNISKSISFREYYESSISSELDRATYAIQQAFEYLSGEAYSILLQTVVSGHRSTDQRYLNQLTQCFTNLIAIREYANTVTKNYVVEGLEVLGGASGDIWVETDGLSVEEEQAENSIIDMTSGTVNTVVPNDLNQARIVYNMDSARSQIDDMVVIAGENMTNAINAAKISPSERAYLYLKVQEKLEYDLDSVRDLARSSAASIVNVSRSMLSTTDVCLSCTRTVGTGINKQKIVSMTSSELGRTNIELNTASVQLNSLANGSGSVEKVLMMQLEKNIFMYDSDGTSSQVVGGVIHLEMSDSSRVQDTVTFKQSVDPVEHELITPLVHEEDVSKFSLHKFIYRNTKDDVCLRVKPNSNVVKEYNLYIRFSEPPTIMDYDIKASVSGSSNWLTCIEASEMNGHVGMTYLGVQTVFKSGSNTTYPQYEFTLVTVACLNWEESSETWRNDQCKLEWSPDEEKVQCVCHQITDLTFANSFFVAPNSIDFSTVFLKFSPLSQAAIIATLCIVFLIYCLVMIWARRHDRRDIHKWGVLPLVDNYPSDRYIYILKVYTGIRLGSGTASRISFRLSGDRRDTGVRQLRDGIRKEFEKGSVMQFIMSTESSLGLLTHIRIWHDNRGRGEKASWYLSKIVVTDLHEQYSYTFICEDWLAVETSDISMEKLLFVAHPEYLQSFNHRFSVRTKERLIDGHLWTSVLYRPSFSNFTRVQRVTCALMALMLNMLANAMYFNPEDNYETPTQVQLGPLRLSLQQVFVGLICASVSTLPTLVVITIFNKSRRRVPVTHTSDQANASVNIQSQDQFTIADQMKFHYNSGGKTSFCSSLCSNNLISRAEMNEKDYALLTGSNYSRCQLPFWCALFGWFLATGAIVTSTFFLLLYSIQWGKQKSEEWLSTFLLSMLESVLIIDPFLIVIVAFCFALVYKSLINDDNTKIYSKLEKGNIAANEIEAVYSEPPLRFTALEEAKRKRSTEIRKWTTIKEIISNIFWLWILFSISYSNRDERTNHLHERITNMMNKQPTVMFNKITNTSGFYKWLRKTAVPALLPLEDFNGDPLHWTIQQYLDDLSNYRLGPPRLRQLRTKTEPCRIPLIDTDVCYRGYSMWTRETDDFCLQWRNPPCPGEEEVYNHSSAAWKYSEADPFSGIPLFGHITSYENGGYKADLDVNRNISVLVTDELYASTWVDRRTRAVILEFTIYCANLNIFAFNMFMVEFPETGGAMTSFSVLPVRVYQHIGSLGTYVIFCEVLGLLYTIFIIIRIGLGIFEHKRKFYTQFWLLFDIATVLCVVCALAFYFIRLYTAQVTVSKFLENKRNFVDFYQVAFFDQLLVVFLGILVFLSTIRCLRILEGNKHVYTVAKIFSRLANDLLWLGIMLIFVFVVFAILGHLLFGTKILSYMNIYRALSTLFLTTIGKSKFAEINETDPILAKIYFSIFVFCVSLLMLSVFLSSLCACIEELAQGPQAKVDDVFLMALEQFISLFKGKQSVKSPEPASEVDSYSIYSMDDTCTTSGLTYTSSDLTIQDFD